MFEQGKSFHVFPFKILYGTADFTDSFLKAGFGVGKKNFKKATDRNRIKRLMKESFRLQKHELVNVLQANNKHLSVFIIYIGNVLPAFTEVNEKMTAVLKRSQKIADEITDKSS